MSIKKITFENNIISVNIAAFISSLIIFAVYEVYDGRDLIYLLRNVVFCAVYVIVMKILGSKLKYSIFNVCSLSFFIFIYNLVVGRYIEYFGYYIVYYYLLKYFILLLCSFILFKCIKKKNIYGNIDKIENNIMFAYNNFYFNLMMFFLLIAKLIMRWVFIGI